MAIHFFANPGNIFQYASQAYGPLNESEYRTTALFTIAVDTQAYAVAGGRFLFLITMGMIVFLI